MIEGAILVMELLNEDVLFSKRNLVCKYQEKVVKKYMRVS
jgi:hypothetical protein